MELANLPCRVFPGVGVKALPISNDVKRAAEVRDNPFERLSPYIPGVHTFLEFCEMFTVRHGASLSLELIITCRGEGGKRDGETVTSVRRKKQVLRFAQDDKTGMVGEWRGLPFDPSFPQNTGVNCAPDRSLW
jgi:hypothetical protein